MEKWLLVSNCQQFGLANCLRSQAQIHIDSYAFVTFQKQIEQIKIEAYDRIVVAPQYLQTNTYDFSNSSNVLTAPHIYFDAYHPDLCYLRAKDVASVKGPIGDYHSLIAFSGFRLGLSVDQVMEHYSKQSYASLGWLEFWAASKQNLLKRFSDFGYDLAPIFSEWGREDAFMHTVNHPKIRVLSDIASLILEKSGIGSCCRSITPHDNLINGAIFPIYPEIGLPLGVQGSYFFKRPSEYGLIDLRQYVSESFDVYRNSPELEAYPAYSKRQKEVSAFLEKTL